MAGRGSASCTLRTVVLTLGFGCAVPDVSALCKNSYYVHTAMWRGWEENDMEIDIQEIEWSMGSGRGHLACCCKHGNEHSALLECEEFID